MASEFDITQAAAGIYAQSLLELATEKGQAEAVGEELGALRELWNRDPNFAAMMSSAAVDEDARRESIRRIFGKQLSPLALNALLVLNDKRRSMILPAVCDAYRRKLADHLGRQAVYVTSSAPLADGQLQKLTSEVKRLTGRDAVLMQRVEPELLGGMRVQIGDRLYDTSVSRRIRNMKVQLHASLERALLENSGRFMTQS